MTDAPATPSAPTPVTTAPAITAPAAPAAPSAPSGSTNIPLTMPQRPAASTEPPAASTEAPNPQAGTEPPKTGETTPVTPTVDPQTPEFKVPEEYKDKPWASKVKSLDDLYKQIDTLDQLKGKKSIVPDLAKATPEEREAYYAQLRPASVDEYVFPDTGIPMPAEYKTAVTDLFMKNGISATQANEIIKSYQELGQKQTEAMFDPKGFEQTLQQAFGNDWKGVTANVRNMIKGMMSESDQKALDNLPNAYLATIYRTLGNVAQKYGVKETDTAHFQGAGGIQSQDINAVRDSIRKELAALPGRPHTAAEKAALRQKLNDTYTNDPRIQQGA